MYLIITFILVDFSKMNTFVSEIICGLVKLQSFSNMKQSRETTILWEQIYYFTGLKPWSRLFKSQSWCILTIPISWISLTGILVQSLGFLLDFALDSVFHSTWSHLLTSSRSMAFTRYAGYFQSNNTQPPKINTLNGTCEFYPKICFLSRGTDSVVSTLGKED